MLSKECHKKEHPVHKNGLPKSGKLFEVVRLSLPPARARAPPPQVGAVKGRVNCAPPPHPCIDWFCDEVEGVGDCREFPAEGVVLMEVTLRCRGVGTGLIIRVLG